MDFDTLIERRGTWSSKWDMMADRFGITSDEGISMWTADSDYRTAPCVIEAAQAAVDHGVFGYSWEHPAYFESIVWWMRTRHGWEIQPDWILTTQGLGHAIALSIQAWSEQGEPVAIFTPVYHEFANKIKKNNRTITECPIRRTETGYELDLDDAQARLTGRERLLIWCSPQNPIGRVWTKDELIAVSDFAERNDMILVSDEIHHDLIFPGHKFIPMDVAAPHARHRTVYATAASKTFNIAGQRTGNMIIPDPALRKRVAERLFAMDFSPCEMGIRMIQAAYSPEGATWADAQMVHLERNRQVFEAGLNAIPGVRAVPMEATFLPWVDFTSTGMDVAELHERIRGQAQIAVLPGSRFGSDCESYVRFNIATQSTRVDAAVNRLQAAFSDLQ